MNPLDEKPQVSHIIYENGFVWHCEKFGIYMRKSNYISPYRPYLCPPTPIDVILKGLFVEEKMFDHIVAFAFFCHRQTKKYASAYVEDAAWYAEAAAEYAARAAEDAEAAAEYAARAVEDAEYAAEVAEAAADAAYYAAEVAEAAARKEQWAFLIKLLEGTKYE
jgi:hypothetical protein